MEYCNTFSLIRNSKHKINTYVDWKKHVKFFLLRVRDRCTFFDLNKLGSEL